MEVGERVKHCLKTAWGWGRGTASGSLRTKSIRPEDKRHRIAYGYRFSSVPLRMVGNVSRCEKTQEC